MSSGEEDYNDGETGSGGAAGSKKRRVQRACDICRRKKIRCDGGQMPGNKCSNCIAYSYECSYLEGAKKRGPPKGYVEGLENRLEKMEKLLSKLVPGGDYSQQLADTSPNSNWLQTMDAPTPGPINGIGSPSLLRMPTIIRPTNEDDGLAAPDSDPEDNLDFRRVNIAENLRQRLQMDPMHQRFFGKSSGVMLIQTAIDLKNDYANGCDGAARPMIPSKRTEFWNVRPWELANITIEIPTYRFPEEDLMRHLLDVYFTYTNSIVPLLHRPTFERSLAEGIHYESTGFGAIILLMCAIASRYSDDPRVFLEETESKHSAGWKWFEQVQMVRKSLLAPPHLYDIQIYCLACLFLHGSSAPQACWTIVGIGVRLAQDVGAHRRKVYSSGQTVEDELWKRAFWALVLLDRHLSSTLGRPCAIQDEDFDLDLPLECDDEYWEHPDPDKAFKQPPGVPSKVSFFVEYMKLNQILAFALRTIYSINKSKVMLGFVGPQWDQHIVAELDSALNKWVDAVPDHLRWDPTRENEEFFNQSAFLHSSYYHVQILIHRPFIPSPRKPSPLSFPSLAICTNAARSCSHVIDIQRKRSKVPLPYLQVPVFTAGVVLLLNIWGGKRAGLATDTGKEMADVHKCMQFLKSNEERWHSAGRLWDVLAELASVGELPMPLPSPATSNKRERDAESPTSASSQTMSSSSSPPLDGPRPIAGSRRISKDLRNTSMSVPRSAVPLTYSLPIHSNELAQLPLHGQITFTNPDNVESANTDQFWFPSLHSDPALTPGPSGSSVLGHNSDNLDDLTTAAAFPMNPMDPVFYGQMMSNNFSSSFGQPPVVEQQTQFSGNPGFMSTQPDHQFNTQDSTPNVDIDTMAMWSNAPTGFELDDWGLYMSQLSHNQNQNNMGHTL